MTLSEGIRKILSILSEGLTGETIESLVISLIARTLEI